MEDLKVGDIIKERYELVKFLGSGSFGEVWLAHDRMTGREVALKIYLSLDPTGVEEFQREYSNTIDLSSPYLLTPEYFDVFHRRPFLVMKYCEHGSSSKLAGNISEEQLWAFIEDVSKGLDVLHSQSDPIVHQDIKPDNILVDNNGRFLITDFGISKRLRATMRRQSKRDVSSGAMPYMAPERFDSNPRLSTASDIWSLGASIYELATGELPFSGFGGAMQRNGAEVPNLPAKFSKRLNIVMQKCMSLEETERPTIKDLINQTSVDVNSNKILKITDFEIDDPEKIINLKIKGHTIETKFRPIFKNFGFGLVWFYALGIAIISFVTLVENFEIYCRLRNPLSLIILHIFCVSPLAMWLIGYGLVKNWKPVGKYLMSGSIYIIIFIILYTCYESLKGILFESKIQVILENDGYMGLILYFINAMIIVFSLFGLGYVEFNIKKGMIENPAVWLCMGNKIIPYILEYIIPVLLTILVIST